MPRTVDPLRHRERRLAIIGAAYECFAELGYEGATTAAICDRAGISSGTFFHYFPTKLDALLAVIQAGTEDTQRRLAGYTGRTDPLAVILDHLRAGAAEAADPHFRGFVRAVSGMVGMPAVEEALAEEDRLTQEFLRSWIEAGHRGGSIRTDRAPDVLAQWLALLLDGFAGRSFTNPDFRPAEQTTMLIETAARLLAPEAPAGSED